jgi:hypothetical protein
MDPQSHNTGSDEARLGALFQAYRAACPDPEPSANFMPLLWQGIEARQNVSIVFSRLARNLMTAALALSILLGLAVSFSGSRVGQLPSESYVEVLADEHYSQTLDFEDPVRISPAVEQQ